jgi:membrane protein implicated in regulation of membrane protease activity
MILAGFLSMVGAILALAAVEFIGLGGVVLVLLIAVFWYPILIGGLALFFTFRDDLIPVGIFCAVVVVVLWTANRVSPGWWRQQPDPSYDALIREMRAELGALKDDHGASDIEAFERDDALTRSVRSRRDDFDRRF